MTEPNQPKETVSKRNTYEGVSMRNIQGLESSGIKNSQSQKLEQPPPPTKYVFNDFDYINP